MSEPVLAIDIGGTKVALALVDPDGRLLAETVRPTARSLDAEAVFAPVADGIEALLTQAGTSGHLRVGVGSAGPIDGPGGRISPVNIPAWRGFAVRDRIATVVSGLGLIPEVGLAGDGHCFALGEHWLGAGRGTDSMVGVVISTGIGGGAVLGDHLFAGRTGNAVHLGHTSVEAFGPRCVCGAYGCVELYASGTSLVAAAVRAGWSGGSDAQALTVDARAGNAIATAVIDRGMRALAAGLAATAVQLDVEVFVIGGGVSRAGSVIFDPLRRHLADFAALDYVRHLEVRPATCQNAGLLGAAALALSLG